VLNGVRGELSPDFSKYKVSRAYSYAYSTSDAPKGNWLDQANEQVRKVFRQSASFMVGKLQGLFRNGKE
jgi:hypothetical protein